MPAGSRVLTGGTFRLDVALAADPLRSRPTLGMRGRRHSSPGRLWRCQLSPACGMAVR